MTAAISLARELPEDAIVVVQETEYTGAGKLPSAQLSFAIENGVEVLRGDPLALDKPGKRIVIPEKPEQIRARELPLDKLRKSYLKELAKRGHRELTAEDLEFISADLRLREDKIMEMFKEVLKNG